MLFSLTVIALIALVIMWACLTVERNVKNKKLLSYWKEMKS